MKHVKTYELFGGPKEGDEFMEQLVKILGDEKIKIEENFRNDGYVFRVDGQKYEVEYNAELLNFKYYLIYEKGEVVKLPGKKIPTLPKVYRIQISKKYFNEIKKLYKQREKEERLGSLPDISDLSRSAKKYNL